MTRIFWRKLSAGLAVLLTITAYAITVAFVPSALAQTGDPPPRATPSLPTIGPTATHTAVPIPKPKTEDNAADQAEATGRITGTVIDQSTGAPVLGIRVAVGDVVVTSDSNGNYGRDGLAAGRYQVALLLAESEGAPIQSPIDIELAQGATVVQHLAFQPGAAAQPTIQPIVTPDLTPTVTTPEILPATGEDRPVSLLLFGLVLVFAGTIIIASLLRRNIR